jgi:hypothetical protein
VPLEDDQIFLHLGEMTYNKQKAAGRTPAQAYYMPTAADTCVLGFRQWIDKWGGARQAGPL